MTSAVARQHKKPLPDAPTVVLQQHKPTAIERCMFYALQQLQNTQGAFGDAFLKEFSSLQSCEVRLQKDDNFLFRLLFVGWWIQGENLEALPEFFETQKEQIKPLKERIKDVVDINKNFLREFLDKDKKAAWKEAIEIRCVGEIQKVISVVTAIEGSSQHLLNIVKVHYAFQLHSQIEQHIKEGNIAAAEPLLMNFKSSTIKYSALEKIVQGYSACKKYEDTQRLIFAECPEQFRVCLLQKCSIPFAEREKWAAKMRAENNLRAAMQSILAFPDKHKKERKNALWSLLEEIASVDFKEAQHLVSWITNEEERQFCQVGIVSTASSKQMDIGISNLIEILPNLPESARKKTEQHLQHVHLCLSKYFNYEKKE